MKNIYKSFTMLLFLIITLCLTFFGVNKGEGTSSTIYYLIDSPFTFAITITLILVSLFLKNKKEVYYLLGLCGFSSLFFLITASYENMNGYFITDIDKNVKIITVLLSSINILCFGFIFRNNYDFDYIKNGKSILKRLTVLLFFALNMATMKLNWVGNLKPGNFSGENIFTLNPILSIIFLSVFIFSILLYDINQKWFFTSGLCALIGLVSLECANFENILLGGIGFPTGGSFGVLSIGLTTLFYIMLLRVKQKSDNIN